jgi:hypothetical protein
MTRRACAAAAAALGSGCCRTGPTPERGGGRESLVGRSGGEAGGDGKDGGWVRLMTAARATWGEGGGGGGLEPDWVGGGPRSPARAEIGGGAGKRCLRCGGGGGGGGGGAGEKEGDRWVR